MEEVKNEIQKELWIKILEKYSIIKEVFIESEETDPELVTNLQPLNEFRAALDHIMKMMSACYCNVDETEYISHVDRLNSHLNRAFYDISDFVCINYRNKIVDILEHYSEDAIKLIIPEYYTIIRPRIEEISLRISKYRFEKGKGNVDDVDRFNEYKEDFYSLRDIYLNISTKIIDLDNAGSCLSKRDYILSIEDKYDSDIVIQVFPNFYSEWVIKLKEFRFEHTETDNNMIEHICKLYDDVISNEYTLKKLSKKAAVKSRKGNVISFILGFFSGLLSSIVVTIISKDK